LNSSTRRQEERDGFKDPRNKEVSAAFKAAKRKGKKRGKEKLAGPPTPGKKKGSPIKNPIKSGTGKRSLGTKESDGQRL